MKTLLFTVRNWQGIIRRGATIQAQARFHMGLVEMHALQLGAFGLDASEDEPSKKLESIDNMLFNVFKFE